MNPSELDRFREVEEIFYAAIDRPAGVERDTHDPRPVRRR